MIKKCSFQRIQRATERLDPSSFGVGNRRTPEIPRTCGHFPHNHGILRVLRVSRCESGNRNENWPRVTGFLLRVASSRRDSRPTCLALSNTVQRVPWGRNSPRKLAGCILAVTTTQLWGVSFGATTLWCPRRLWKVK
jgi:hypothetical protein